MNFLENQLQNLKAYRQDRLDLAHYLIAHPEEMELLMNFCTQVERDISYRAAWILEMVFLENPTVFYPHTEAFMSIVPKVFKDQAVRPFGKIISVLTENFYSKNYHPEKKLLILKHRNQLAESCFDWLISNQKTAAKAYAMQALFELGKEFDWIHPELKQIIQNNYENELPAYKARARMVLKSLKKYQNQPKNV